MGCSCKFKFLFFFFLNFFFLKDIQQRVYSKMGYTSGLANYRNFIELNQVDEQCHLLILNNSYYKAQKQECTPLWLKLIGNFIKKK